MKESEFLQDLPSGVPPPPPPPNCLLELEAKPSPETVRQDQASPIGENELKVAVQRLLSSEKNIKDVFYISNVSLVPQLQEGPKCGLVALSIATSNTKNFVNVKDIFELALANGFTKQGEIFDASALAILAEKLGFKAKLLDGGLNSHLSCILKSLLNRCLLLVPYDAYFNHAPCCKEGSRAHWAIISGFVIMEEKSETEEKCDVILINSSTCNANVDRQLYFSNYQGEAVITSNRENKREIPKKGKVYLIGLQGKSRHVGLWSFDDMALSNNNLIYFPPSRNPEMYIVPEGGVVRGLKGRAVLLDWPGVS